MQRKSLPIPRWGASCLNNFLVCSSLFPIVSETSSLLETTSVCVKPGDSAVQERQTVTESPLSSPPPPSPISPKPLSWEPRHAFLQDAHSTEVALQFPSLLLVGRLSWAFASGARDVLKEEKLETIVGKLLKWYQQTGALTVSSPS